MSTGFHRLSAFLESPGERIAHERRRRVRGALALPHSPALRHAFPQRLRRRLPRAATT